MEAVLARRWKQPAGARLLAWGLALQLHGGAVGDPVLLARHSVRSPPDISSLANEWFLGGTTIPNGRNLVLSPGVPGRMGTMWSLYPLLTADFEATMTFQATKASSKPAKTGQTVPGQGDDGFAFWYVYENATAAQVQVVQDNAQDQQQIIDTSWPLEVLSKGFDRFGYRTAYDGLGVFFVDGVSDDNSQPYMAALANSGGKMESRLPRDCASCLKYDWSTGEDIVVKLRVQSTGAQIEVVGKGSTSVSAQFRSGGYIGFSLLSGFKPGGFAPGDRSTYIELKSLQVLNHDASAAGEEEHEVRARAAKGEKEDVLAGSSSFRDHRAESDAIKDLTNMVFKVVAESEPQRKAMAAGIASVTRRIDAMETTFRELRKAIESKSGDNMASHFDAIKMELSSLSSTATDHTLDRRKKMEALHSDIAHVHRSAHSGESIDSQMNKLTESNDELLNQLTGEHQKMFGVSIAAIAFIIVMGLSLYNKFRCWEKKHIM
jgi:hypothetical protein